MDELATTKRLGYRRVASVTAHADNFDSVIRRIHAGHVDEPIVMRQLARSWPACSDWSIQHFRSRFGSKQVPVVLDVPDHGVPYLVPGDKLLREMTLSEFVDILAERGHGYLAQSPLTEYDDCINDVDLHGLLQGRPCTDLNLWLGRHTKSGLHFDLADNFVVMISGSKFVALARPGESSRVYPFLDVTNKSQLDVESPDFSRFPRALNVAWLVTELQAGDVLYIPQQWWHYLASRGDGCSISLNCWWQRQPPPSMRSQLARTLSLGPRYAVRFLRDFLIHGVGQRPFMARTYSPPPDGVMFYHQAVSRVATWILRK